MSITPAIQVTAPHCFSIDKARHLLWNGDTSIKVPPKVFQLFMYLRDNPGRIIEYDELLDAVWPHEFVQPEVLKTYIKTIRRLLNDNARAPRFIETRIRCGYCFIGHLPDRHDRAAPLSAGLVGRAQALSRLQEAGNAANAGQRQIVFISGELGIGKTRLIDEFTIRIGDPKTRLCLVDCAPAQYAQTNFSAVRELRFELLKFAGAGDRAVLAPDMSPAPDAGMLFRDIEAMAVQAPLTIVIENLQWADSATIELLSRLAYARAPARLMIVASYRTPIPNDQPSPCRMLLLDLLLHGAAKEISLAPLNGSDVKCMVLQNSTVPMTPSTIEAIDRYAGGNPLVISSLVSEMIDQVKETGANRLADVLSHQNYEYEFFADAIPGVIRHALELQLYPLSKKTLRILECGSNNGSSFCAWGVAHMLEAGPIEIEDLCRAMCGSDRLLRESGSYIFPDNSITPIFSFRNRLYARLLHSMQSYARRQFLHSRFTAAVERFWGDEVDTVAQEMIEHFECAGEWSRALHYAKLAITTTKNRATRSDAVFLLQKGLQISDHLPEQRRVAEKDFFLRQLSQLN